MIPDAPYIREAETLGMPPYDEPDFSEQAESLKQADMKIDSVINLLLTVEDDLNGTIYETAIHEIIIEMENAGADIRNAAERIQR
jgi:hypothetical protein